MGKTKFRIIATLGGVPQGYIKSIHLSKGSFDITSNRSSAKTYATLDSVMSEIDRLTLIGAMQGYVFIYE